MFKILVALKANLDIRCGISVEGKTKHVQLPQKDGIAFSVKYLAYYREQAHHGPVALQGNAAHH